MKLSDMQGYKTEADGKTHIGKGDVLFDPQTNAFYVFANCRAFEMALISLDGGTRLAEPVKVECLAKFTRYEVSELVGEHNLGRFEYIGHISEWKRQS